MRQLHWRKLTITLSWYHGWIRWRAYLFQWKYHTCPALFSEREGHRKFWHLGLYRVRLAKE
jgi:hypothetical protein